MVFALFFQLEIETPLGTAFFFIYSISSWSHDFIFFVAQTRRRSRAMSTSRGKADGRHSKTFTSLIFIKFSKLSLLSFKMRINPWLPFWRLLLSVIRSNDQGCCMMMILYWSWFWAISLAAEELTSKKLFPELNL